VILTGVSMVYILRGAAAQRQRLALLLVVPLVSRTALEGYAPKEPAENMVPVSRTESAVRDHRGLSAARPVRRPRSRKVPVLLSGPPDR